MREFLQAHPKTKWAGIVVLALLVALVLFLSFFDWNWLRPALAHEITAKTGRPAAIDGDLKVHIWSWSPTVEVDGLRIENPPWADRKIMFAAKSITVRVSLLRLLRGQIVLPLVQLQNPEINLERDKQGRASWELGTREGKPKPNGKPPKVPTIQQLVINDGQLHVVDEIRKLTFSGSLVAGERTDKPNPDAFKIRSSGTLNAKPFRLDADGGPLFDLEPSKPYSFSARITASDINLETHVTVLKPFNLGDLAIHFVVSGDDLADVFYLTGLALPNTPKYRLEADVRVDGTLYKVTDLTGRLGDSDLEGDGSVQTAGKRPELTARLHSKVLDIVDLAPTLGHRAPESNTLAAHEPTPIPVAKAHGTTAKPKATEGPSSASEQLLLPNADLQVNRVRGMNANVDYRAAAVKAPHMPLKEVNFHLVLADGLLTIDPLDFDTFHGQFAGKVQIDARPDIPVSDIDMRIRGLQLSQFKSAAMKEAPLDGTLLARFKFHGAGSSVHKFAAASNGAMSAVIPEGEINQAMAELTGVNVLSGLGLLISKPQQKIDLRCGIMDFEDKQGQLDTTTFYIDTSKVLITARGGIDLRDEDLNLVLQGHPKAVQLLHLNAPIDIGGTMLHPAFGVKPKKLLLQAGVATALGVLLTPAAAALAFIDPGLTKNKDCATVMEQARAGVQNMADVGQRPAKDSTPSPDKAHGPH